MRAGLHVPSPGLFGIPGQQAWKLRLQESTAKKSADKEEYKRRANHLLDSHERKIPSQRTDVKGMFSPLIDFARQRASVEAGRLRQES